MKKMEDDKSDLLRITANKARFDSLTAQHQVVQQYKVQQNQLLHQLVQPAPIVLQPQPLLEYVPLPKPHHVSDVSDGSDSSSESDEGVKRAMERAKEAYKKKRLARKQAKKESRKEVKKSKKRRRSRSSTPDEKELRHSNVSD